MINKNKLVIVVFIVIVLLILFFAFKGKENVGEEIAKCIGQNSELYVQLGCIACGKQEAIFGENIKYLNLIDCAFESDKCLEKEITYTPTWIIKGEKYVGVQSAERLNRLTGC